MITSENDLEKTTSEISSHKRQIMQGNVATNLNIAISNYNALGYECEMPVLTYDDWDQVFSNISMITFFQGVQIGLKYYNNYAIATSTSNKEYVDPNELYFSGEDTYYHRVYCKHSVATLGTGYRSIEYLTKETVDYKNLDAEGKPKTAYYFAHDSKANTNSELACYYCITNRAKYEPVVQYSHTKAYDEALARERYYQRKKIEFLAGMITITYDANLSVADNITEITMFDPATYYITYGETHTIVSDEPIVKTNDGVKYILVGWSEDKEATGGYYKKAESFAPIKDTTLYAVWKPDISTVEWKKDYYWPNESAGDYNFTQRWEKGKGRISLIWVENDNSVNMIGNSVIKGKGATWCLWRSEYTHINEFIFDYSVNYGDSFNGAGLLFNIDDSNVVYEYEDRGGEPVSGYITGYMLSFNNRGSFNSSKYATIWTFKYIIGENSQNFVSPTTITKIADLDIRQDGHMDVKLIEEQGNYGYEISATGLSTTYFIPISESNIHSNSFGFFSDHYSHNCTRIGSFKLTNVNILITRNK